MTQKLYTKRLVRVLPAIVGAESNFIRVFGDRLEVLDGISNSDTAMSIKVTDTTVVVQTYNTDPNVAFGTGTGNTNRFGPRHEIKSVELSVNYKEPIAIHEGIDKFTVNDFPDSVAAERIELISQEIAEYINGFLSEELSANASATLTGALDEAGVIKAFDDASKTFTNNKIKKRLRRYAFVSPDVYNILVNANLTTTGKRSGVNIDDQEITKFKGFEIVETPETDFQDGENIYFAAENVGLVGVGIEGLRTFESDEFFGLAIQFAGKYAAYIAESNKVGILKATLGE